MKKTITTAAMTLLIGGAFAAQVFAFSDVPSDQFAAINSLTEQGVVKEVDAGHFAPKEYLNYAQAISIIVKGFNLNLDTLRFFKMPVPTNFYPSVKDNVWYSDAFITAHYNGITIPHDVDPRSTVTREQFAKMIEEAMKKAKSLPMIKIVPIEIKDNVDITVDSQGFIQRLLHYKIIKLDQEGRFQPKQSITRGDSAVWIYNALEVLSKMPAPPEPSAPTDQL